MRTTARWNQRMNRRTIAKAGVGYGTGYWGWLLLNSTNQRVSDARWDKVQAAHLRMVLAQGGAPSTQT